MECHRERDVRNGWSSPSTPKPRVRTAIITVMDQIFSHIADQVALSGPSGMPLTPAITTLIPDPRASFISYIRKQFEQQSLFTVTPTEADVHITAHPNLRRRALGVTPLEHPPLPQPAWTLLEAIGRAGPAGLLQAKMGPIVGLQPNMVHHYIGLLSARRLIGRRKIVLQRSENDAVVATTYTSVIVLARYAAQMLDPLSSEQAADSASDIRLQRVLNALRQPPYVRAERDLKIIAIPDSDRPSKMTREHFQRRRHRNYRSLRSKLIRLGVAAITKRKCVTQHGRVLGAHPCLKLLEPTKGDISDTKEERRVSHPLLAGGGDRFVAEVDIVEQVYRMLVEAGPSGISVPELHQYLDSKSVTSAPAKRIRTIINAISKIQPTVERQYFEGSAMYLRISLHGDTDGSEKRRKIGMTSLGERRQEIVMELLQQRKVLILETLGREVARVEEGAIAKVDPKVMRRLILDLVTQKRVKLITTARPTIKDNPRSQSLVLVALPDVNERGEAVRRVVTSVVNRSLYGSQDNVRDSAGKQARKLELRATGKVRKRIAFGKEDDEPTKDVQQKEKSSAVDGKDEALEDGEEPVIMYEANNQDGVSDDQYSADEKNTEEEDSEINIKEQNPALDEISSSRTGLKTKTVRNGKKKATLKKELVSEPSKNKIKKRVLRKRKASDKRDESPPKRQRNEKKRGKAKLKRLEHAESERTSRKSQEQQGDDDTAILIKTQTRNLEGSRVLRLRAVDYGCLKGKLARVRRFHKNLYEIMRARDGDDVEATPAVQHITLESARETPVLGRFSFISMVKEMNVGEYAATVGIYMDHGDTIKKIEREKIAHVLDDMNDEITSNTASRQVQQFVQTMTKLELIRSDVDSQWLLTGAGIIRDFGRGLPSGVVPHGILFSSCKAIEGYWLELEQFSRCKMSRKPVTIDLRKEENVKQVEAHPVGDLYFPKKWATGVHRLQKQEQLAYETILQRLSGVQVVLEEGARLRTDNFITGKLRWFSVEELDKEMERVLKDMQKEGDKPQSPKRGMSAEQLLLYCRFRNTNPIPKWFLKPLEAAQKKQKEDPSDGKKEILEDNSSLLQLTRTPSSIKVQQVRVAMPSVFDASHHRYFKTRARPKPRKESPPEGQADLKRLVSLIRAIVRGRAVAYHRNDADGLDWKVIPSLTRFEIQQSSSDLKEAAERENLRRAIVALCEITTVRAALDILSVKLVLKLHELSTRTACEKKQLSAAQVPLATLDLVNSWDSLNAVCIAIVMEVREDVRHHAKVLIRADNCLNFDNVELRRGILSKEFGMARFLHGRPRSFAHTIEMMASRFRRVADIRLFREARYAVLLTEPYGEATAGEGMLEDGDVIQCGSIDKGDHTLSKKGTENVVASTTGLPRGGSEESQGVSRSADEDHHVKTPQAHDERSAIIEAEGRQVSGIIEDINMPEKTLAMTSPQADISALQSMESIQPTLNSELSAHHQDPISLYQRDNALHCPPELAELVVCTVVRQPPHAQWKAECLKLLSQFREEDLADARDRLILRGSLSVHAERERTYCCLQPCKNSEPTEAMATLRGDMGDRNEWDAELRHAKDDCLENTNLWRQVCSLEGPSSFATAYSAFSTFFDEIGLRIVPEFEEDDEATPAVHDKDEEDDEDEDEDEVVTRVKLYFQYGKHRNSTGSQGSGGKRRKNTKNCERTRRGEAKTTNLPTKDTDMRQKVAHEIAESGRNGVSLEALLIHMNPQREEEKLAIAGALNALLQDGGIRRFAIETSDENWEMTTGVLYICTIHCAYVTAWHTPNGEVDQQLVSRIRDEVFECILRLPGCKSGDIIHSVCARHTSLPRRAVADILFSLEGELLTSSITVSQSGWHMLRRGCSTFVDEMAIMTWGQRCIQSYSGDATKFSRIENCQWRQKLSSFL